MIEIVIKFMIQIVIQFVIGSSDIDFAIRSTWLSDRFHDQDPLYSVHVYAQEHSSIYIYTSVDLSI